jgi:phosphoesterase RecJ-like protein
MEAQDGVKMSFRSKGAFFVNDFAEKNFSGGGHKYAAGGFSSESLNVTISRFKSLVDELKP